MKTKCLFQVATSAPHPPSLQKRHLTRGLGVNWCVEIERRKKYCQSLFERPPTIAGVVAIASSHSGSRLVKQPIVHLPLR